MRLHVLTRGSLEVEEKEGKEVSERRRQGRDVVEEAGGQVPN